MSEIERIKQLDQAEQPYGARNGTVKDPFGNTWYIATQLGK